MPYTTNPKMLRLLAKAVRMVHEGKTKEHSYKIQITASPLNPPSTQSFANDVPRRLGTPFSKGRIMIIRSEKLQIHRKSFFPEFHVPAALEAFWEKVLLGVIGILEVRPARNTTRYMYIFLIRIIM